MARLDQPPTPRKPSPDTHIVPGDAVYTKGGQVIGHAVSATTEVGKHGPVTTTVEVQTVSWRGPPPIREMTDVTTGRSEEGLHLVIGDPIPMGAPDSHGIYDLGPLPHARYDKIPCVLCGKLKSPSEWCSNCGQNERTAAMLSMRDDKFHIGYDERSASQSILRGKHNIEVYEELIREDGELWRSFVAWMFISAFGCLVLRLVMQGVMEWLKT